MTIPQRCAYLYWLKLSFVLSHNFGPYPTLAEGSKASKMCWFSNWYPWDCNAHSEDFWRAFSCAPEQQKPGLGTEGQKDWMPMGGSQVWNMAGSEEDHGGCRQGSGMDQFCFISATGSDLIRFMVSSAWHCLSPLQSLCMLSSLFPRSHLLGIWESICCKKMVKPVSVLVLCWTQYLTV